MIARLSCALLALTASAPALAEQGAQVPEGSNLTLFALGVAGVLIGRRVAIRRRRD